jgi:hypothetical protein
MSVTQSVADILDHHVTFQLECIDRMYLNVYVPMLQCESGVVKFSAATAATSLLPRL